MLSIFISILVTTAIATLLIYNPISLAITILTTAITTAILTSLLISSWIAFLLFLIYIGGILVIFAYFVATSPNAPINIKIPIILRTLTFYITFIYLYNSHHTLPIYKSSSFLNTFYSSHTTPTLMILALILLLTIIIVVKLVSLPKGPLRPFI